MVSLLSNTVSIGFFDAGLEKYKTQKPWLSLVPLTHAPKEVSQTNIEHINKEVLVHDIRGAEDQFQIDVHGFQLIKHSSSFTAWHDGKKVVTEYHPHIVDLLKRTLKAEQIYVYDHTMRLGDNIDTPQRNRTVQALPSKFAHSGGLGHNHTIESIKRQIQRDFGDDTEDSFRDRFQVINRMFVSSNPSTLSQQDLLRYRILNNLLEKRLKNRVICNLPDFKVSICGALQ